MARKFAAINLAIWNDDDFRALSPAAQHAYFLLMTEPKLSYCGVADWRPKHLAQRAKGWTVAYVMAAVQELIEARLIVVCDDTDEYLVRSFVRHDGVMSHPKLCVSAANAVTEVGSNALRQVVIGELKRLQNDRPDLSAWTRNEVSEILKRDHLNGKEIDPFREPFSPGFREALREAFSLNGSQAVWSPYERPYTSTYTTTPLHQHQKGEELRTQVTSGDSSDGDNPHEIQPCGRKHDAARPCAGCKRANDRAEDEARRERSAQASTAARHDARLRQEAIDACGMCDERGYLANGKVCHHVESVGMSDSVRESLKALKETKQDPQPRLATGKGES